TRSSRRAPTALSPAPCLPRPSRIPDCGSASQAAQELQQVVKVPACEVPGNLVSEACEDLLKAGGAAVVEEGGAVNDAAQRRRVEGGLAHFIHEAHLVSAGCGVGGRGVAAGTALSGEDLSAAEDGFLGLRTRAG